MYFFNIQDLDKPLIIKLWSNHENLKKKLKKTNIELMFWTIDISISEKNNDISEINYLSLNEIKKIDFHKKVPFPI